MSDYYEEDEGIHFDPYDEELINDYLIRRLSGQDYGDFIVDKDVYAIEPWFLDHNMDPFFQKNEWYYFVRRTQVSEKNIGHGKKAKRKIITGDNNDGIERGNWKANAKTDIKNKKTGKIIGVKQTLTYTRSDKNIKKQKREDGTCVIVPGSDSSWIMTEYMLPEGDKFQELVLCKIKKFKKKDDHREASTSTSTSTYHHHEASTSHHHHEASTWEQQQISDLDSVLASSSEQEEPLLGRSDQIPRIASLSSLTCPAAETERSSEKDEQDVTHELEEDWVGDLMDIFAEKEFEGVLNTEDQQPPPISAPAHMNVPLARFGDKSLPIELDDNSNEDEEWNQELDALRFCAFLALTQDQEDAHNMQWMDQGDVIMDSLEEMELEPEGTKLVAEEADHLRQDGEGIQTSLVSIQAQEDQQMGM